MHGATDASELQPKLSLGCPRSLQDAPWTFPGPSWSRPRALRTDPKQLFRAPEPFRSISGRCRMDLDRSKTAPTQVFVDLSSNFRRICIALGTFWSDFLAIWCDVLLDCLSAFLASLARRDMLDDPCSTICFDSRRFATPFLIIACESLWDRRQVAKCSCPVRLRHPFVAGQHRH